MASYSKTYCSSDILVLSCLIVTKSSIFIVFGSRLEIDDNGRASGVKSLNRGTTTFLTIYGSSTFLNFGIKGATDFSASVSG